MELERLRAVAEEANRRKTQLLASVSHDIRTPLNAISLIADVILLSVENPSLAAKLPDLEQRLRRNTRSLDDLVSALVDISSLDAGRVRLHNSEFSLNDFFLEQSEGLVPLAQAKGLQLTVEAPEPPVRLVADYVKLARVLNNLVGNAIKFTETGSITVTTRMSADRELIIQVSDTGVGIGREDLEKIFEAYGQLGNPQRDASKGWGLGLTICRRLVDAMDGKITIESKPNNGAIFSVHLPASCVVQ